MTTTNVSIGNIPAFQEPPVDITTFSVSISHDHEIVRINKDTEIGNSGWRLALDMGVDLEYTQSQVIATNTWIDEYGHGACKQDAIEDLLTSLAEFRESLERQEQRSELAEELVDTLENLRALLVKD